MENDIKRTSLEEARELTEKALAGCNELPNEFAAANFLEVMYKKLIELHTDALAEE